MAYVPTIPFAVEPATLDLEHGTTYQEYDRQVRFGNLYPQELASIAANNGVDPNKLYVEGTSGGAIDDNRQQRTGTGFHWLASRSLGSLYPRWTQLWQTQRRRERQQMFLWATDMIIVGVVGSLTDAVLTSLWPKRPSVLLQLLALILFLVMAMITRRAVFFQDREVVQHEHDR